MTGAGKYSRVAEDSHFRLWVLLLAVAGGLLLLFFVAESVGPAWLTRPTEWQDHASFAVGIGSVVLMASDVVLPVPSSVVMLGNGVIFGWGLGALLSTLGALLSSLIGYALGRAASSWAAARIDEASRARLVGFIDRYGVVAIVASRPIPIVAEMIAILAGSAGMPWPRFLASAAAGSAIMGIAYSGAGDLLTEGVATLIVFAATAIISGLLWWLGHRALRFEPGPTQ